MTQRHRARPPTAVAHKTAKIGRASDIHTDDTVVIFNRPIVTFRAPFLGIAPSERAAAATDRIVGLLERGGPGKVAVEHLEPGDAVKIDGSLAFLLTRDDVDRLSGETFDALVANDRHGARADHRRNARGAQRPHDGAGGALGGRRDRRLSAAACGSCVASDAR